MGRPLSAEVGGGESTIRFTKPKVSRHIVDRARLYRHLERWRDHRAVVVQAQAGYGKTTLISRWIDVAGLDDYVAWIAFDATDADPRRFVRALATSLDRRSPGALSAVRSLLEDRHVRPQHALNRLLDVVADINLSSSATGRDLLLVIDDLQTDASSEIAALIRTMLEGGPEWLHLILAARESIDLPLARLYAREDILLLDRQELRFTTDEIRSYLRAWGFGTVQEQHLALLMERSEGWISALQLAMLSRRGDGDLPELQRHLQGDRGWLASFLGEEVLDSREPGLRRFLLQTSILDGFDAALCEAVTESRDAAARLAEIADSDLFLVEIDRDRGWFRYHALFQEMLSQRLKGELDSGAVAELHRRAAGWLSKGGQTAAALGHLLAAGDEDVAAGLVERSLDSMIVRDGLSAEHLFELLPARIWSRRPRLVLLRALLALIKNDPQVTHFARLAEEALGERDLTADNAPELYGMWLVVKSGSSLIARDHEAAFGYAERAESFREELTPLIRGMLEFIQVHRYGRAGEPDRALEAGERALAAFARLDFSAGTIAVQRGLARYHQRWGNGREATRRFRELVAIADRTQENARDLGFALVYAAENSYWRDDLEQARRYHRDLMMLARVLDDAALTLYGDTMGAVYHPRGAESYLADPQRIDDLIRTRPTNVVQSFTHLEIRRRIAAGQAGRAWGWIQEVAHDVSEDPAAYRHPLLIPYLRARIACGVDLATIRPLLVKASTDRAERGLRFEQLHLMALLAWHTLKVGGPEATRAPLAEATRLARETGYIGVLSTIPELARELSKWEVAGRPLSPARAGEGVELTERERQVLALLEAEYTYAQIGAVMSISINTVRTHVRHLYRKFSVRGRDQAIRTARRLGFLQDFDRAGAQSYGS